MPFNFTAVPNLFLYSHTLFRRQLKNISTYNLEHIIWWRMKRQPSIFLRVTVLYPNGKVVEFGYSSDSDKVLLGALKEWQRFASRNPLVESFTFSDPPERLFLSRGSSLVSGKFYQEFQWDPSYRLSTGISPDKDVR